MRTRTRRTAAVACVVATSLFGVATPSFAADEPSFPDGEVSSAGLEMPNAGLEVLQPTASSSGTAIDVPGRTSSSTASSGTTTSNTTDTAQYSTTAPLNGIDISKYQPDEITATVPSDFVVLRASRGVNEMDRSVAAKYAIAQAEGKLVGLYHYSDANFGNSPEAEADAFVAVAESLGAVGNALLILDHEAESQAAGGAPWALRFLNRVRERTGVTPLIYGSVGVICNASYAQVAAEYPLWAAKWLWGHDAVGEYRPYAHPGSVAPWSEPVMHQYTSSGSLPGHNGRLDVDVFYGSEADWHELAKVRN